MKYLGKTAPFLDADGAVIPGSIAEISYLLLGGFDQWVMIRGESLANPLLILLHGGPGFSETSFFRRFNAPLEKAFTVVYWDQRGSGRSYSQKIPRDSMTVEQLSTDLDELVDAVCKRVGQSKVFIFGHSWGSVLGVLYAARFPNKVAAYVGSGQIGDWPASEVSTYHFSLAEAQRLNDHKALKALRDIGPPPHTAQELWTQRTWLNRLEGESTVKALWHLGQIFFRVPETTIFEILNVMTAFQFSLDAMWAEVSTINLIEAVPALQMPVFFFLGRRDRFVFPEISTTYFNALSAPSKKIIWFENSGHQPFADEPGKFNTLMVEKVRVIAAATNRA
ncbi:hydrolase, alpha/beta fold family, putative [Synechococcus sp. PCC 7335]|uniref:alpha/beta fold hydrolase n=1 Tax=Synechococcus sp. (strain ATCC 29403 / PCC 7335) TaxID=91464 RepID=UPI00017ECB5A|nr:alpha/beta hydrolase [Synechococcus sp. PCC 7335]EDX82911.1 hydrolase, alpha/beta fold family, putative [Synechococcus sp. PCC 7335]